MDKGNPHDPAHDGTEAGWVYPFPGRGVQRAHAQECPREIGFGYSSTYLDDDLPYLDPDRMQAHRDLVEFCFAWVLDECAVLPVLDHAARGYDAGALGGRPGVAAGVRRARPRGLELCLTTLPADHRAAVAHHAAGGKLFKNILGHSGVPGWRAATMGGTCCARCRRAEACAPGLDEKRQRGVLVTGAASVIGLVIGAPLPEARVLWWPCSTRQAGLGRRRRWMVWSRWEVRRGRGAGAACRAVGAGRGALGGLDGLVSSAGIDLMRLFEQMNAAGVGAGHGGGPEPPWMSCHAALLWP